MAPQDDTQGRRPVRRGVDDLQARARRDGREGGIDVPRQEGHRGGAVRPRQARPRGRRRPVEPVLPGGVPALRRGGGGGAGRGGVGRDPRDIVSKLGGLAGKASGEKFGSFFKVLGSQAK